MNELIHLSSTSGTSVPPHGFVSAPSISWPCACQGTASRCPCCIAATRASVFSTLQQISEKDLNDRRNRFISKERIMELFNTEFVSRLLKCLLFQTEAQDTQSEDSIRKIGNFISPEQGPCTCESEFCTGARILFATLILLAKEDKIEICYKKQICDSRSEAGGIDTVLDVKDAELFYHLQWPMKSPYFKRLEPSNETHIKINNEASLPWTELSERKSENGEQSGQFSVVWKIKIHPHHHDMGGKDEFFALKAFKQTALPDLRWSRFREELKAIQRLGGPHPHILPLLSAFEHKGMPYLIFPWADGGSLTDMWKAYSTGPPVWYSTQWLWEQCRGLASGLAWMHGYESPATGQLHADITPDNILVFSTGSNGQGPYNLMLADFGLARQLGPNVFPWSIAGTITYRPPEKDLNQKRALPQWDIWCLGCLYVEFLTWCLLDHPKLEDFVASRLNDVDDPRAIGRHDAEDSFFRKKVSNPLLSRIPGVKVRTDVIVKESVMSHIRQLKMHDDCDGLLRKLLIFVEQHMLVVDDTRRADTTHVLTLFTGQNTDRVVAAQ